MFVSRCRKSRKICTGILPMVNESTAARHIDLRTPFLAEKLTPSFGQILGLPGMQNKSLEYHMILMALCYRLVFGENTLYNGCKIRICNIIFYKQVLQGVPK